MQNDKANWKVHFNKFLKHIAHDLQKGIDGQRYNWHNIQIETLNDQLYVNQNGGAPISAAIKALGTEAQDYKDNSIQKALRIPATTDTIKQVNSLTTSQETNTMAQTKTQSIVDNATSTIKTVGAQIQSAAITSAKMEAGENILLALRNIVMSKAGFMQKVKFKFAPVALDTAVTLAADVLVAELMPDRKSAKLAVECLNLAMTKEILHELPIKDFTNALTGGEALKRVTDLMDQDK